MSAAPGISNGAGGRNRTGTGLPPTDFLTSYGFHRRPVRDVCGLDYTFTLARSRLRCCPSSLYTFRPAPSRRTAWLGIAISGFPEFEQFCIPGFPESTQKSLFKSVASTSSATPA